jgi:transcriptional regulator with XRE-family HTH domain
MGFGDKLRQKRLEKGITQEQIARKLGYESQSYVSDVEHNKFIPNEEKLRIWAKALGLSFQDVQDLILESKIEKLGISDPAITMMFKDIPNMTTDEKQSIVRAYEAVLKSRHRKKGRKPGR